MSQPSAVASASFARSSPRCQLWTSLPRFPSGFSRLWSGPATKPSSEIDMWQVVRGIASSSAIDFFLLAFCDRLQRTERTPLLCPSPFPRLASSETVLFKAVYAGNHRLPRPDLSLPPYVADLRAYPRSGPRGDSPNPAFGAVVGAPYQLRVTEAVRRVIVDHAHRLHERVNYGGTDEPEPPTLQVPAKDPRCLGLGGNFLQRPPAIVRRLAADEAPEVSVEGPEFLPDREEGPGVADRRLHLPAVADYAGIGQQFLDLSFAVPGDLLRIEAVECAPVAPALLEDRQPAQARLRPFQHEHLEEPLVVVDRDAPLLVVVGDVERVGAYPGAATPRRDVVVRAAHSRRSGAARRSPS